MLTGKDTVRVEFIESYIKHGAGDYEWNDNHGELIRCKDCMHRGNHNICPVFSPMDDFYCGHGERKE